MGGLHYLAGYVVHKTLKAANKLKPMDRELTIDILQNATTAEVTHKFIEATNRGGLKVVKDEWIQLFIIAENIFRKETLLIKNKIDLAI